MIPGVRPAREDLAVPVESIRAYEINNVALGIPLVLLMENAGRAVADVVETRLGGALGKTVHVLAGKGGNGGDGIVAARHLAGRGARVTVHLAGPPCEVRHPDARLNLEAALRSGSVRVTWPGRKGWLEIEGADAVVDAMLGIGVRGALRGHIREMAGRFNESHGLRVAIDTPTGLDPDTGVAVEGAVRADLTITMGWEKRGFYAPGARFYTGEILVAEIGVLPEAMTYAGPGDVAARLPARPPDAHKGVGGRVLIVAGGEDYVGAALLASAAACRSGVDLVYLASPRDTARTAAARCSSVIPVPFKGSSLSAGDSERIAGILPRMSSVLVGPGIGRGAEHLEAAASIMLETIRTGKPLVVDADGLHALKHLQERMPATTVLTPHRGEARMLAGRTGEPRELALEIAEKTGATVLVKAPVDVACSGGKCRLNRSGVPAMSVGGTGDVLSGLIAGLLARRASKGLDPDPLNTAITAAYIVGRAGELAAEELGEELTAGDVLDRITAVIRESRGLAH